MITLRLALTRGLYAVVDSGDFETVSSFRWYCTSNGYAARVVLENGKKHTVYLHRVIANAPPDLQVDHLNGMKLDCRRQNLRLVTPAQNAVNRRPNRHASARHKGVSAHKRGWQARIWVTGKSVHLGYFDTEVLAALMYDTAARRLHGEYACLNIPEVQSAPYFESRLDLILMGQRPRKTHDVLKSSTQPQASKYRGVHWQDGRWRATARIDGQKRHIGYFLQEEAAARAYDSFVKKYRHSRIKLNFPDG